MRKNENFLFEFSSALLTNLLLFESKEGELFQGKISVKEVLFDLNFELEILLVDSSFMSISS